MRVKHELRHVDPLRAANIGALVYGLMMAVFALLFSPFFLLAGMMAPAAAGDDPFAAMFPVFGVFLIVLYPLMGAVMGWISGLLGSAIYNLVVRWSGGLLVELETAAPASS